MGARWRSWDRRPEVDLPVEHLGDPEIEHL
jgi:hypothetical protein